MPELLLEIFSEEIPARMQARAADDLARLLTEALLAQGLEAQNVRKHAGPRRLAVAADGLPEAQPDTTEERKGPQVNAPAGAIQGFLKAAGLADISQAEVRELPKGKFYFAVTSRKGRPTKAVLAEVIAAILPQLPWPKSMRWGTNPTRWVRPVQSILCLFAGEVVRFSFAGREAGDATFGHRFLSPDLIRVRDFADYGAQLRAAHVVVEAADRARVIVDGLARLAQAEHLTVRDDPPLLAEVTGLVEWPVPLLGTIDAAFMDVPAEVLTSAMRKHQKYFALTKADGSFAPRFGVIANMVTSDNGAAIIAGNERVLRSRLSDAKFFWDQDRARSLESRVPKLKERVFHAKLGTVFDKIDRIVPLSEWLERFVPGATARDVRRAAYLCKADLSTGMVGEFPDLQGIMGRYYALHDGEAVPVANAIAAHYAPAGPLDRCPAEPASVIVALADKLDSLAGFFAINEKPTGSKDPFALRRAALGVIRLILENKLRLPLLAAFEYALGDFGDHAWAATLDKTKAARELLEFFGDRLKVHLREAGVRHDLISAVFALGNEDDLLRLMARVEALAGFLASDDGANLLVAYRRAANIVRIEEKRDDASYKGEIAAGELGAAEATALLDALVVTERKVQAALEREDFVGASAALAALRRPVDSFFEKVTVNTDQPQERAARLRLLARIGAAMGRVADFGQIEG